MAVCAAGCASPPAQRGDCNLDDVIPLIRNGFADLGGQIHQKRIRQYKVKMAHSRINGSSRGDAHTAPESTG